MYSPLWHSVVSILKGKYIFKICCHDITATHPLYHPDTPIFRSVFFYTRSLPVDIIKCFTYTPVYSSWNITRVCGLLLSLTYHAYFQKHECFVVVEYLKLKCVIRERKVFFVILNVRACSFQHDGLLWYHLKLF